MSQKLKATNKLLRNRTVGVNTFMKLPLVEEIEELEGEPADFAVVGIPDDSGAFFRVGQRFAPNSIREISAMLRSINMAIGTNIDEELRGFDNGDVNCVPSNTEENQHRAAEKITKLVEHGIIPVSMGGDHSISLGPIRAVGKHYGAVGLIHFDSHVDSYEGGFGSRYNNGTTLRRGIEEGVLDPNRIISVGIKGTLFNEDAGGKISEDLGVEVLTMQDFEEIGIEETIQRIRDRIGEGPAYLTFDIDCMDPSCAPGGAVYELGGFNSREIIRIMKGIKDLNIVGYDIAEVCPQYDTGSITSYMAAEFMHMFIAMIGIRKRNMTEKQNSIPSQI
ncbi:agmatinase [Paenibacillus tuaregi]|uniref:agmatinase n=1 Tax=Paenibacillus tuaregi TaxID=1816681 RepID=UPI0009EDA596|nr:agmatinase [Paenibacillus tuaregi]